MWADKGELQTLIVIWLRGKVQLNRFSPLGRLPHAWNSLPLFALSVTSQNYNMHFARSSLEQAAGLRDSDFLVCLWLEDASIPLCWQKHDIDRGMNVPLLLGRSPGRQSLVSRLRSSAMAVYYTQNFSNLA